MRGSLILKFVIFPVLAISAYLAVDFWNVNRTARLGDSEGMSVSEYLASWTSVAKTAVAPAASAAAVPLEMAAMMPKAPEGWTVQPTTPADVAEAISRDVRRDLAGYITERVTPTPEARNIKELRQTYVKGDRRVIFQMVRHPDKLFKQKMKFSSMSVLLTESLGISSPRYKPRPFMTVRGMEFTEDRLPDEVRLRLFVGNVGMQYWVWVLAPLDMTDEELLPFFQTLHVPAMAADVVLEQPGMGEVPVIVLASVLEADARAAWETEKAARAAKAEQLAAKNASEADEEKAKKAAQAAEEKARKTAIAEEKARGVTTDEATGVKIRKGSNEQKQKQKKAKSNAGFSGDGCSIVDGRKTCGSAGGT